MSDSTPFRREDYAALLAMARSVSPRPDDAEDLLHRSLMAALQAGRLEFREGSDRAWFYGVLRNQARMLARSESRRRRREEQVETNAAMAAPESARAGEGVESLLDELPTAQRQVLVLLLVDLDRREICDLLEINDSTLRQRMVALRRQLGLRERAPWLDDAAAAWSERESQLPEVHGRLRRSLLKWVRESGGVGAIDPDGHPIAIDRPKPEPDPQEPNE